MDFFLVVDDEPSIVRALGRILESEGHTVRLAQSGAAALAIPERPALAILDVMMPGMSGVELAHRLRERMSDLPILFVTGAPELVNLAEFPNAIVLPKPWRVGSLLDAVRRLAPSS